MSVTDFSPGSNKLQFINVHSSSDQELNLIFARNRQCHIPLIETRKKQVFSGLLNLYVCIWMVTRGCLYSHWRCGQSTGLVVWIAPSESYLPSVTYWATPRLPAKLQQCEQGSCCVPWAPPQQKMFRGQNPWLCNVHHGSSTYYPLPPANPTHAKSVSSFSLPHVPGPADAMHLGRQKGGEMFLLYPHLPDPFLLLTASRHW